MPPEVTVPIVPALTTWRRVELARAGTWNLQVGGEQTFTPDDFAAAVAAVECPAIARPVIKLGHLDDRGSGLVRPGIENRDGEPALGWIGNMAVAEDGESLVGDYVGMPGWLGQIAASAYPSRSIEGARNYRCALGHVHPFVISAVALLGLTPPAVATVGSLQDHVRAIYGVAAGAEPDAVGGESFTVTIPAREETTVADRPVLIAAAVTTDDLRAAYYANAPADAWVCEIQLDPLQLIVQRDGGDYCRVPVTVNPDGSFTFGAPIDVEVQYVDETPAQEAAEGDIAAAAGTAPKRVRFTPRGYDNGGALSPKPNPVRNNTGQPITVAAAGDEPPAAPTPTEPPAPVPTASVAPAAPVVPAAEPEPVTDNKEGDDNVSLSGVRSALGLPDDADEATVLAALDELKTKADKPAEPNPELVAAAAKQQEEFAAALGQIKTLSEELSAVKAEKAAEKKAAFFAAAVGQGKIAPAERESWETRYDQAPDLVTEIINAMAPGTAVPVAAAGYTGSPEPQIDDDKLLEAFFSPSDIAAMNANQGV